MKSSTTMVLDSLTERLRFRARTRKGREVVLESGPHSPHPDPVETALTAIGACHAMDVISILRKKRQDVTGYEVEVNAERMDEHPRHFTAIEMIHRVRGRGVSPDALEEAVRLSEEKYCSLHHSLRPDIRFTKRLEIVEEGVEAGS